MFADINCREIVKLIRKKAPNKNLNVYILKINFKQIKEKKKKGERGKREAQRVANCAQRRALLQALLIQEVSEI